MLLLGLILGLFSALGSSVAYLLSRRYAVSQRALEPDQPSWRGPMRLLATSHVWLGGCCLVGAFFLWPGEADLPASVVTAVATTAGVAFFYMLGNVFLFITLMHTDASRVSPLLGMKIVILAVIVVVALGDRLTAMQWGGVALATFAAMMLASTGGRLGLKPALLIAATCLCFVMSDLCIRLMIEAWLPAHQLTEDTAALAQIKSSAVGVKASMLGMCLSYLWAGTAALAILPVAKASRWDHWRGSMGYAGSWFVSMVLLFACFALVGIVLGNILQSTRGLMSIALGSIVAWAGHHHLEAHASRSVVLRRALAAVVMTAAVALYAIPQGWWDALGI